MSAAILVTGGAGYIGSHTCKALAGAGFLPVTLDNLSAGHRWAVRWGPLVEGDLADRSLVERVIRKHDIRGAMHFAAWTYVGESMQDPGKYFRNNFCNALNLLQALVATRVDSIVFSSTCATYGMPQQLPIPEDEPQIPVNPYGESKLCVERALRWFEQAHGLRYAALRYFNAAGADPDGRLGEEHDPETHLIPLVMQAALGIRDWVEVYGADYDTPDGTAIRDYIHVCDLADAHVRALDRLLKGGASLAVNLGSGRGHSVRDVIDAVARISERPVPVRESARRAGDPPILVADPSLALGELGWSTLQSDLAHIVASAWHWHSVGRQMT